MKFFMKQFLAAVVFSFVFFHTSALAAFEQDYFQAIHLQEIENFLQPQQDIVVAVLDSGVLIDHEDLRSHIWINDGEIPDDGIDNDQNGYIDDVSGFNFIDNTNDLSPKTFHGTAVAGVIAAERDNGIGIDGVATKAKIMPLVICDVLGECDGGKVLEAIRYAADNGAKVINLSLGGQGGPTFSAAFDEAIAYAYRKGVVIVAAAGNGDPVTALGIDLDVVPQSPVCNDHGENMVLGIGATVTDGSNRATWSNFGSCVDVFAPGENIELITHESHSFIIGNGTSFAAPIISGLAAQILSAYPSLSNQQLYQLFLQSINGDSIDSQLLAQNLQKQFADNTPSTEVKTSPEPATVEIPTSPVDAYLALKDLHFFDDVSSSHPYAAAINYLKKHGIVSGYSSYIFKPNQKVTRAELLKIIMKGSLKMEPDQEYGQACFSDVEQNAWYAPYICYAKEAGWVEGYSDATFQPNREVSLAEALKLLFTIEGVELSDRDEVLPFQDIEADVWYKPYVSSAYTLGLLDKNLSRPGINRQQTRGQIAELMFRLLTLKTLGKHRYDAGLMAEIEKLKL